MIATTVRLLPAIAFLCTFLSAAEEKPQPPRRIEVLFLGDDSRHEPLERYRTFKEVSGNRGINLTYEKRLEALTPENLARFDVLLVYANHPQITAGQLAAILGHVRGGGGFMPVHCGSACFPDNDDYIKLVGGQPAGHGEGVFTARIVEPDHPAMQGYEPFETWDQTSRHHRLADDITILQRHDGEPWTWVREEGAGRVFYTAHGHDSRCWLQEGFHELLERGIRWAAGGKATPLDLPDLKYEIPLLPDHYRTTLPVPNVQQPLPPEESMLRAQVPAGFELSLFAAEPDVVNPIAIAWDHRDRLWVVEALDYPNDGAPENEGRDRLKICEDTDGDGRADKFTVFAEGLSLATSVVHAGGGAIVSEGSKILLLKDTDGDDHADERTVLIDGFKTYDTHAGVSNLRYGFDGWIYATVGYAGFEGVINGQPVKFDTGAFRFLPDGSQLEFLGKTTNNTWGLGFTEDFDVLGSTANRLASWQVVGDHAPVRHAGRGTRVFPTTLDVQGSDGWDPPVELLGEGRIRAAARHYTAAAGHGIYTARRFPEAWWNRAAFVCEPTGHLVSTGWMRTENADHLTEFEGKNLYASSDAWSAPVAAETGPDGAVWIADWYNIIVQHNRPGAPFEQTNVEKGKGAAYVTPLRENKMGRIYRVFPKGSPEPAPSALDPSDPATLLAGLSDPSLIRRLHAQRLIVESGDGTYLAPLESAAPGEHGIHALHALAGLGHFHPDSASAAALLTTILGHENATHRRTALALWPEAIPCPFDVRSESHPFVIREWLLLAARMPADESLGRELRDWHRNAPRLRLGEVLDRCYASAVARHSTGFLLASLDVPPDPSVLAERIYPAAIRAFAANRSPQILARLETDDSPLARALKEAVKETITRKTHTPPADQLARGESIYERTCAVCHQRDGSGVDGAFPPLDGSPRTTGDPAKAIRIVLHGMTGPVDVPGKLTVNSLMPPLATLDDSEIADVLTFIRHAWSNDAPGITEKDVARIRTATMSRNKPWTVEELE